MSEHHIGQCPQLCSTRATRGWRRVMSLMFLALFFGSPLHAQLRVYDSEKSTHQLLSSPGLWLELADGISYGSSVIFDAAPDLEIALHVKPTVASPILSVRYIWMPADLGATQADLRAEFSFSRSRNSIMLAGVGVGMVSYDRRGTISYFERIDTWTIPLSVRAMFPFMNGGLVSIQSHVSLSQDIYIVSINVGLWLGSASYPALQ